MSIIFCNAEKNIYRMLKMDNMISFTMKSVVTVSKITVYGSVNGADIVSLYQRINEMQCRSFTHESNIKVSAIGIGKKLLEFFHAMCPYHEDVINVSVINSLFKWKEDKRELSIDCIKIVPFCYQ